jgi:hypothetical protein
VKKGDATLDYHENVNKEGFMKWFRNLLEYFDKIGKKYLIVMDNAP